MAPPSTALSGRRIGAAGTRVPIEVVVVATGFHHDQPPERALRRGPQRVAAGGAPTVHLGTGPIGLLLRRGAVVLPELGGIGSREGRVGALVVGEGGNARECQGNREQDRGDGAGSPSCDERVHTSLPIQPCRMRWLWSWHPSATTPEPDSVDRLLSLRCQPRIGRQSHKGELDGSTGSIGRACQAERSEGRSSTSSRGTRVGLTRSSTT